MQVCRSDRQEVLLTTGSVEIASKNDLVLSMRRVPLPRMRHKNTQEPLESNKALYYQTRLPRWHRQVRIPLQAEHPRSLSSDSARISGRTSKTQRGSKTQQMLHRLPDKNREDRS